MTTQLAAGTMIVGRYKIIEELGHGGNASVHRAHDQRLDTDVALKILWPQLAGDATFVERFRREAQTMAKLSHPNILRLFELGEDEEIHGYFLVLEYLTGGTLKDRLGPSPWGVDETVELLKPIASAMDYAHTRVPPVVHRDMKPSNILFNAQGSPVVSDFGVARLLQAESAEKRLTGNFVIGTPAYMAPEQVSGSTGPASDRYALGVIAYELLVGRVPHRAAALLETLLLVSNTPPPRPRDLNPTIEQQVEDVLLKALAHEPARRYSSSAEFVLELEKAGRHGSAGKTMVGSRIRLAPRNLPTLGTPMPGRTTAPIGVGPDPTSAAAPATAAPVPRLAGVALEVTSLTQDAATAEVVRPGPQKQLNVLTRRAVLLGAAGAAMVGGATIIWRDRWGFLVPAPQSPPSMAAARTFFTIARLANNDVLVVGGQGLNTEYLASAERFQVSTNRWAPAGEMATARAGHTATPLPDGQLVVIGGQTGSSPARFSSAAERYDAAKNIWVAAGEMTSPRLLHNTVPLADGKLLVVGGFSGAAYLASAELYDPVENRWAGVTAMAAPRVAPATVVLASGEVLVVGGFSGDAYLATAERYNPSTQRWTMAGEMATPRAWHTATLLSDGRVLIAGGYVLAKDQTATFFSTVELYDPTTNRWSPTEPMSTGRTAHTATALSNGDVLVVGGQSGRPLDTAERYNPRTNVWTPAGQMSSPRTQHQAVALADGQVLVAGGQTHADNAVPTAAVERYDPSSNRWSVASAAHSAASALL